MKRTLLASVAAAAMLVAGTAVFDHSAAAQSKQGVKVGTVNVESGAQAVVGQVNTGSEALASDQLVGDPTRSDEADAEKRGNSWDSFTK